MIIPIEWGVGWSPLAVEGGALPYEIAVYGKT